MTVIVGYDRHPASRAAVLFGRDLARDLRAPLHIVHVLDHSDTPVDPDCADWDEQTAAQLRADRAEVVALLGDSEWTYHTLHGDVVGTLVAVAAKEAGSLLVVGQPGHGLGAAVDHVVNGAVARALVRRSTRPVVVVPASTR